MYLPDSSILTNIEVQGHPRFREILFEKKYILIRTLENRLYTDEELSRLPEISPTHTHFKEWQVRKSSTSRLIRYLSSWKRSPQILEIGCGNGWLSHQLAEIPGTKVTGMDINFTELQQAARVFSNDPNLRFIHGDIDSGILDNRQFDCIIFAASIQYFPSLKKVLYKTLSCLKPGGEIHVLDTPFYKPEHLERARRRTMAYYTSFGYPEMADYYFHHSIDDLRPFHHMLLHNPNSMKSRIWGTRSPFPWIRIKDN
jgi:SAM-dependent methyltransferase